jgi:hypothetical protein
MPAPFDLPIPRSMHGYETKELREAHVAALEREKDGYQHVVDSSVDAKETAAAKLAIAAVDKSLKVFGAGPPAKAPRAKAAKVDKAEPAKK